MEKKEDVKVSIILTSHNRPVYLKEAIDSILKQTISNWELIIIDDCSTESGVLEVLTEAKQDLRIRAYRTNYDADHISVFWNLGLDLATGTYISLLDDDNTKLPTFCEEMSGYLDKHTEFDAVACYNAIMILDRLTGGIFDAPKHANRNNMKTKNYIDSGCAMFRRSLIDKIGWFDERLTTQEDWDYFKKIMLQASGFGVIEKPLATFRWHKTNRQYNHKQLGGVPQEKFIATKKNYSSKLNLLLFHPEKTIITLSQNNVLRGTIDALNAIDWIDLKIISARDFKEINSKYDIIICFAPFIISLSQVKTLRMFSNEVVHLHIEDPQALAMNLERAKTATYVFTNDISAQSYYEKIVNKGNVGYCPSISLNDISLKFRNEVTKKNEILFLGHPYESRVKFMKELAPKIKNIGYNLSLVGEGWPSKGINCQCRDDVSEQEALELMEESKIVILYNRRNTDLGGMSNSIKPTTAVRGYFEAASGALIMLDVERGKHNFNGGVVFYKDANDLAAKIDYYMKHPYLRIKISKIAKEMALRNYTYRVRLSKLLNAVRSKRYYYEVC